MTKLINGMKTPQWKPIPGLPYEASTSGEIRSLKTGRVAKTFISGSYGYPHVTIHRDGWVRNFRVHTLVALAFHGPRPERYDVDHIDGNPKNNQSDNLEYVSHQENMRRSKRVRKGESHPHTFLTNDDVIEIRRMEADGEITDLREVMAKYNLERKTLYNIRKRISWKHI